MFLCRPEPKESPLFGPSMGFDASRAALRIGYVATKEWLQTKVAVFIRRFSAPAAAPRASA